MINGQLDFVVDDFANTPNAAKRCFLEFNFLSFSLIYFKTGTNHRNDYFCEHPSNEIKHTKEMLE